MSDHLLDTSILIRYLRRVPGYRDMLRSMGVEGWLYISAVTRLEIVRGMRESERQATFALLDSLETIQMTSEVADLAGELIRLWRPKGVILGDADAVIAASALKHGLALVTTNARHFPMPDLIVFQADEEGRLTPREK